MTAIEKQRQADMVFLALVVWREARGESDEGKAGVIHCVLNRVDNPKWWGRNVCQVIFKKWQFSSMTDPKDPQLTNWPDPESESWQKCFRLAECAIFGTLENPVPEADSYHDISIPDPAWAPSSKFIGQIGRIKFYNTDNA
uniref:Putative cell wall hydrolase n=1 Tax=viral metagenome TaxID=1070528 RepID=A0A6M3KEV7_9ZZZZ